MKKQIATSVLNNRENVGQENKLFYIILIKSQYIHIEYVKNLLKGTINFRSS